MRTTLKTPFVKEMKTIHNHKIGLTKKCQATHVKEQHSGDVNDVKKIQSVEPTTQGKKTKHEKNDRNQGDIEKTRRVEIYRGYTVPLTPVVPSVMIVPKMITYIFPKCPIDKIATYDVSKGSELLLTKEYIGYYGVVKTDKVLSDNDEVKYKAMSVGFVLHTLSNVQQSKNSLRCTRSELRTETRKIDTCYCFISSGDRISLWKVNFKDVQGIEMSYNEKGCMFKDPESDCRVGITSESTAFQFIIEPKYWKCITDPMYDLNESNIICESTEPKKEDKGMKSQSSSRMNGSYQYGSVCLPIDSSMLFGKNDKMFDCQEKQQYGIVKNTFKVFCEN